MALTGGRITASIYGFNGNSFGSTMGYTNNFPNVGVVFYAAKPNTTVAGVTINAIIEVLPTGLNPTGNKYYTDSTVAQLVSNGS